MVMEKEGTNHHNHTLDFGSAPDRCLKEELLVIILDGEHHISLAIQSFLQTTLSMTLSASVSFKPTW